MPRPTRRAWPRMREPKWHPRRRGRCTRLHPPRDRHRAHGARARHRDLLRRLLSGHPGDGAGEVAVVAAQRLRVATDVIIRQIKSIVPYKARNRDDEEYVFFMGTASSMAFITAAGLEGGGGLTRVVYQVMDDPPRLVMSESPFFSTRQLGREPVDQPGLHSAVLLDGFRALKFEYLFYEGVEPEWRTEWNGHDEEDMLPVAVRVLVDGIPGLEVNTWGQEIPGMAAI